MSPKYVVRRPFKSSGVFYAVGTLLTEEDAANIKFFRFRLDDRKIMRLPENKTELESLCSYYQAKLGVDLAAILAEGVSKGSDGAETGATGASAIPTHPGTSMPAVQPQPIPGITTGDKVQPVVTQRPSPAINTVQSSQAAAVARMPSTPTNQK